MLNKEIQNQLKQLCRANGYTSRGRAFFRVQGDGVLVVLKFTYEPGYTHHVLCIGLFSMYGELLPQWFTSGGCIPNYPVAYLGCDNFVCSSQWAWVLPEEEQLRILADKGFPWLNRILTQRDLIGAICHLDSMEINDIRWSDMLKFAPYLCCGEFESAAKVIQTYLTLHVSAMESWKNELAKGLISDGDFALRVDRSRAEISDFQNKMKLAQSGDRDAIQAYCMSNYLANHQYAKFCIPKE